MIIDLQKVLLLVDSLAVLAVILSAVSGAAAFLDDESARPGEPTNAARSLRALVGSLEQTPLHQLPRWVTENAVGMLRSAHSRADQLGQVSFSSMIVTSPVWLGFALGWLISVGLPALIPYPFPRLATFVVFGLFGFSLLVPLGLAVMSLFYWLKEEYENGRYSEHDSDYDYGGLGHQTQIMVIGIPVILLTIIAAVCIGLTGAYVLWWVFTGVDSSFALWQIFTSQFDSNNLSVRVGSQAIIVLLIAPLLTYFTMKRIQQAVVRHVTISCTCIAFGSMALDMLISPALLPSWSETFGGILIATLVVGVGLTGLQDTEPPSRGAWAFSFSALLFFALLSTLLSHWRLENVVRVALLGIMPVLLWLAVFGLTTIIWVCYRVVVAPLRRMSHLRRKSPWSAVALGFTVITGVLSIARYLINHIDELSDLLR